MLHRCSFAASALLAFVACAKSAPPPAPAASPLVLVDTTHVEPPSPGDAGVALQAEEGFDAVAPTADATVGPNVALTLSFASMRKHPVGRRLGALMRELPPWTDPKPSKAVGFDAFRDTDWLTASGPSLVRLDKDVLVFGYSVDDALVERAIVDVSGQSGKAGAYAVGVPGVKATRVIGTYAERVFLRVGPKLVAVAPPALAKELAARSKTEDLAPKVAPSEALRLVVRNPSRQISIRSTRIPTELRELRVALAPHDDGSATLRAEGTVTPAAECANVAHALNDTLTRTNDAVAKRATRGLLDSASFVCKNGVPTLRLEATQAQLEGLFGSVAMAMGLPLDP